jgi:hypothetical protein
LVEPGRGLVALIGFGRGLVGVCYWWLQVWVSSGGPGGFLGPGVPRGSPQDPEGPVVPQGSPRSPWENPLGIPEGVFASGVKIPCLNVVVPYGSEPLIPKGARAPARARTREI